MSAEDAIYCTALTKIYTTDSEQVVALRGVDMDVKSGELYMLVGPSGCGKTTLISVISGILDQNDGECLIFGNNIKEMSSRKRIDFRCKNIGFVFQAFNLLPSLTAAENVAIPLILCGEDRKRAVTKASELLEKVGLGERLNSFPTQLSGGQQQRVAIARAIVHTPKVIVCDEPTSALDSETGLQILELLRTITKEKGLTLIVVTHDNRIYHLADRIAQMNDGAINRVVNSWEELEQR